MNKKALTLIELLAVIVIVGAIIAFVLPVFGRAKAAARKAQCFSNLRQIGIAWYLYWDDNDEVLWDPGGTGAGKFYSYGGQAGSALKIPADARILNRYVDNDYNIFICPSDEGSFGDPCTWEATGASYPYNASAPTQLSAPTLPGKRLNEVRSISKTILVSEDPAYNYSGLGEGVHWHHRTKSFSNILFIDGHVEYILITPGDSGEGWTFIP